MGGAVESVVDIGSDIIGGVGGAVNNVVQQIPGIGPVLGPAAGIALGQNPISAFGSSLTGQLINNSGGGGGGGGGSSTPTYAQPNINYGNNTYAFGDSKLNANPYFISGDKGVYNLLPALGQINAGQSQMQYSPSRLGRNPDRANQKFSSIGAQGSYTPYEAHQDILAQMANDPTALAAYNKAYSPTALSPKIPLPGGHGLPIGQPNPNSPLGQFHANNPNPYGNQYVNFGLNKPIPNQPELNYNRLASYAAENKNPFFLPYETTQGATPLGFTPSQNALAPIDTTNYVSGYNTANTAQQKYIRDQQQAARDAREAQQRAQEHARNQQQRAERDARDARRSDNNNMSGFLNSGQNQGIGGIGQAVSQGTGQTMGLGQATGMGQPPTTQGIAGIGQPPGMQSQPQVQPQRRNR